MLDALKKTIIWCAEKPRLLKESSGTPECRLQFGLKPFELYWKKSNISNGWDFQKAVLSHLFISFKLQIASINTFQDTCRCHNEPPNILTWHNNSGPQVNRQPGYWRKGLKGDLLNADKNDIFEKVVRAYLTHLSFLEYLIQPKVSKYVAVNRVTV